MIDWANENAGQVNLLFAAVVALSAIVTAAFTSWLTWETMRLRKAKTDPHVEVYLDAAERTVGVFYLVIHNIGRGPAYRLSFDVERVGHPAHEKYMGKLAVLRDGMMYLGPGQQLWSFVGTYEQLASAPVVITATYYGNRCGRRPRFSDRCTIDARRFEGVRPPHPLQEKQTRALEQIARELEHLRNGRTGIRVSVDALGLPSDSSKPASRESRQGAGMRGLLARLWGSVRPELPTSELCGLVLGSPALLVKGRFEPQAVGVDRPAPPHGSTASPNPRKSLVLLSRLAPVRNVIWTIFGRIGGVL